MGQVEINTKAYWKVDEIEQDLRKNKADIVVLNNFLAKQVFGSIEGTSSSALDESTLTTEASSSNYGKMNKLLDYLKDDGKELDANEVNTRFHTSPPILQSNEIVEAAYRARRDAVLFTDKRVIVVNVKGMSGKRIEYTSYPLIHCKAFAISTGGGMWSPSVTLYTSGSAKSNVKQDLSKKKSNVWAVQK